MFKKKKEVLIPNLLVADYSYNLPISNGRDTVRFVLAPVKNYIKPYVLIVIARPIISPMNYPLETYDLITGMLNAYSIDFNLVDIYLDFEERFGKKHQNFDRWVFSFKDGYLKDNFIPVMDVPEQVKDIREKYYRIHS